MGQCNPKGHYKKETGGSKTESNVIISGEEKGEEELEGNREREKEKKKGGKGEGEKMHKMHCHECSVFRWHRQ